MFGFIVHKVTIMFNNKREEHLSKYLFYSKNSN